jgi:hypothetical protein
MLEQIEYGDIHADDFLIFLIYFKKIQLKGACAPGSKVLFRTSRHEQ